MNYQGKFLLIMAALFLNACESFVTSINEDDITRAQDAELRFVVTAAELNYMGTLESELARLSGLWSGYFSGVDRQPASYYAYNVNAATSNTWWNNVYASALKNIRIAQQKSLLLDNRSTLGICQVMEASLIGTAAALWGDVPHSEAAQSEQFPDPIYDNQAEVIDVLVVLLDTAIVNLQATSFRDGDFLFGSNPNALWIATANSVKARLLLYRRDYVNALQAANAGIQLPSNDFLAKHGSNAGERNLFYEFQVTSAWSGSMKANNTWLGGLLNSTSPGNRNHAKTNEAQRLARYYTGTSPATYTPNTGNGGYFAQAAPFPLHTASETKLIAAECYLRTGDFANALIKLNEHRANLRTTFPAGTYTDFVPGDFDPSGLENLAGILSPSESLLREILEEKYVCLFGQVEAFTEIRRTGNALGLPANNGLQIPQRLLYPQTEINANAKTPNPIPGLFEKTVIFQ